jgi:hypothetical protein
MDAIKAIRLNKKTTVTIIYDESPQNPRKGWDCNIGTIVAWHSRYNLSDEENISDADELFYSLARMVDRTIDEEDEKKIARIVQKNYVILPVYMFDHSGIALSVTPFSCSWDSGQVGFIYTEKKSAMEALGIQEWSTGARRRIEEELKSEVDIFSSYVSGDVYGFIIMESGDEVESCYGFYGDDMAENGLLGSLPITIRQGGRVARELHCYKAWKRQRRANKRRAARRTAKGAQI